MQNFSNLIILLFCVLFSSNSPVYALESVPGPDVYFCGNNSGNAWLSPQDAVNEYGKSVVRTYPQFTHWWIFANSFHKYCFADNGAPYLNRQPTSPPYDGVSTYLETYKCPVGSTYFRADQKCAPFATNQPYFPPNTGCKSCEDVGEPINPGNANMWHTEHDFATSGTPSPLTVVRTYNSSPYSVGANVTGGFGARWTHPYDAQLTPQAAQTQIYPRCYHRTDGVLYEWCDWPNMGGTPPTLATIPTAVTVSRGDGRNFLFNHTGGDLWGGDPSIRDSLTSTNNADATAIAEWTYRAAEGDTVEKYGADGKLTSISSRTGARQRLTYSDGISNDSSGGRLPANAPICSNIQAGAVLPAGRLLCATDDAGRSLQFEYDEKGRITKTVDPTGQAILYTYDGPSGGCTTPSTANPACSASNLTQVTYPDGKSKKYYYNEASQINGGLVCAGTFAIGNGFAHLLNSLTGLEDENGARHIRWTYDCKGMATSSELANAQEKVMLSYGAPNASGARTTTVTHVLGTSAAPINVVRQYAYIAVLGQARNSGIDQPGIGGGTVASRTYDANGNVASRTDWNGSVTTTQYDLTRNLEIQRVEASGTPQARTISTSWHPTYRLPLQIAEPKKITTISYDSSGNAISRTEQATTDVSGAADFAATATGPARTWTSTYNGIGQLLTVTGPRTDVLDKTSYAYGTGGNLATITNAAGHITTLSNYDANGRVGLITDPNGATTTLVYTVRGWLDTRSTSAGGIVETTHYDYDGAGQLKKVTLPGGSVINYTYDAAHRLTDIVDHLGNSVHYTYDNMSNRIKEEVKDNSGMLTRQVGRVFDTLNRMQQVTGAQQ